MDRHIHGICPRLALDPPVGGCFTGAVGGDGPLMASPQSPPSAASVGFLQALIKHRVGVALLLPAWAANGEDRSRRLAQPAPHAEPASLAECRFSPLGRQPAGCSAFGLPRWLSPRQCLCSKQIGFMCICLGALTFTFYKDHVICRSSQAYRLDAIIKLLCGFYIIKLVRHLVAHRHVMDTISVWVMFVFIIPFWAIDCLVLLISTSWQNYVINLICYFSNACKVLYLRIHIKKRYKGKMFSGVLDMQQDSV
jgi:hypothetical protein